ncbi:MAG: hypothetical protein V4657_02920 [Pseudomonadota bacterium]
MATMLYRKGTELKVNNDLMCDTITVEDKDIALYLSDGWFKTYNETDDEKPKRGRAKAAD